MTTKLKVMSRFGIAPNHLLSDKSLSLKAKGLYTYMQSKPDGWSFNANRISFETKDGIDSILAGLKELEDKGYLVRQKSKDIDGKWVWEHVLLEFPSMGNPSMGNPVTKKEIDTKKYDPSEQSSPIVIVKEPPKQRSGIDNNTVSSVLALFRDRLGVDTTGWAINKTQRQAIANLVSRAKENHLRLINSALDVVVEYQGHEYLPQILSPYDLDKKWNQLRKFREKYGD
jgi:hypothetical protein